MKYLLVLFLAITVTCKSSPVLGKFVDWSQWTLPATAPLSPGYDISTTTLSPLVPEAPWIKWAKLKAPVAPPPGSPGSPPASAGSAPAVTPWSPWLKAKPIPPFIKPKLFPFLSPSAPAQSLTGESQVLPGPQSANPAVPNVDGSSLANPIPGFPGLVQPSAPNAPLLPWNKLPAPSNSPGNPALPPSKEIGVPETFWAQLLKLTSPQVDKTQEAEQKDDNPPTPEDATNPLKVGLPPNVKPAPEIQEPASDTELSSNELEQLLESFPGLKETLLKLESNPEASEKAESVQLTDSPVIPSTVSEKKAEETVPEEAVATNAPPTTPKSPQELFLELLKLKGIQIPNPLELQIISTAAPKAAPSLPNPIPSPENPQIDIPADSLKKLQLSEPVLTRLFQMLNPVVDADKNDTKEKSLSPTSAEKVDALELTTVGTPAAVDTTTVPAASRVETVISTGKPPSNPETLWTEWLKLKTPKTPVEAKPTIAPVPPPSEIAATTPESPLAAWIKSQTLLANPVPKPLAIPPKKIIPGVPSPVKATVPNLPVISPPGEAAPTVPEIWTQWLKLKTPAAATPPPAPSTVPGGLIAPVVNEIKSSLPLPPTGLPISASPALAAPVPGVKSDVKAPASPLTPGLPITVNGVTIPAELWTQLLKLEDKVPVPPEPTLPNEEKLDLPLPPPELPVPGSPKVISPVVGLKANVSDVKAPASPPQALPIVVDGITIPAEIWTQLLKAAGKEPVPPVPVPVKNDLELPPPAVPVPASPASIATLPGVKINIPDLKTPVPPPGLPITVDGITIPEEILIQLLKLQGKEVVPPEIAVKTEIKPDLSLPPSDLPITSSPAEISTIPGIKIKAPDVKTPVSPPVLPITVDGITIPGEIWTQLLKLAGKEPVPPETSVPVAEAAEVAIPSPIGPVPPAPPASVAISPLGVLPPALPKEPIESVTSLAPITVDGIPIPEQLLAELLKLQEPKEPTLEAVTPNSIPEAPWMKWIKINSPPAVIPKSPAPFLPAPPKKPELSPETPGLVIPPPIPGVVPVPSGILPPSPVEPEVAQTPLVEPPWIQWIKMNSPPAVIPKSPASLLPTSPKKPELSPETPGLLIPPPIPAVVPVPSGILPPTPVLPKAQTPMVEPPWIQWIKMNSPPNISNPLLPPSAIPTTPEVSPENSPLVVPPPGVVWPSLLNLNPSEIPPPAPPGLVLNPAVEPPWLQWIKLNSPPVETPTDSNKSEILEAPPAPESETIFASWLKPLPSSEAPVPGETVATTELPTGKPIEVEKLGTPAPTPPATVSDLSAIPVPVGLPETFWAELMKSYAISENKTKPTVPKTEPVPAPTPPVPVDPWAEWLQKLDVMVSTPVPEIAGPVPGESTTVPSVISETVTKSPLHNLTCCEWLAKLLPPDVLNATLLKLQQTRSLNSQNPRHHHSSSEESSSEEMKRAVGVPEPGMDSPPTPKPKLDIVPPGFWAPPSTEAPTASSPLSAIVDPAFWAAKKAMFISNLFSALAKVALNATEAPPSAVTDTQTVQTSVPQVLQPNSQPLTNNVARSAPSATSSVARSASSDSEEESSESRLKRKSKKKSSNKKQSFHASSQNSKPKIVPEHADKKSKPKTENKSKSQHSKHHHNHHDHNNHHSVKKSSETTTTNSTAIDEASQPHSTTTTENPVDFASLAKALLV